MNETTETIAQQINARELAFNKFKIAFSDEENYVSIRKGRKRIEIKYDGAGDLYVVTKQKFKRFFGDPNDIQEEVLDSVFFDQLKPIIETFFKFDYVLEKLRVV